MHGNNRQESEEDSKTTSPVAVTKEHVSTLQRDEYYSKSTSKYETNIWLYTCVKEWL